MSEEEEKNRKYGQFTYTPQDRARNYRRSEILQRVKDEARALTVRRGPAPTPRSTHVDVGSRESTAITTSSKSGSGTYGQYHINPQTGRPNKCYASKKPCPFGGGDTHYESKAEARKGYEKKMRENTIPTAQKR